jgi:hypothetical protein
LNHPEDTENSPSTRAVITLNGVLSILGVFNAARCRPSIATSRSKSWNTNGILTVSFNATKAKTSGSQFRFCINSKKTGVKNTVKNAMTALETFRYTPVILGK